jgi:hypothetical protein
VQVSSPARPGESADSDSVDRRVFAAITEAMAELRAVTPLPPPAEQQREARREAYMRTQLRAALASGARNVVVVCGAWHAPALTGKLPSAAADARVLKGTPKRKVALTWVPWTHSRLSIASGYGAGISSPGWYDHLFSHPELTVTRWLTKVARVLRAEDLPVSSAHVIEAVRLAEALATLRGRQLPGLDEVTEAVRAVLVDGDELALSLVTSRLVVGEALGTVPEDTPTVPLEADLRATAKTLRLKFEALEKTLDLDLRREGDLGRSHLLHRLTLLGVPWLVVIAFVVVLVSWLILRRTVLGLRIYAVGGNPDAARLAGVKVWAVLLFVYGMSGLLAGLGGVMSAARLYAANGLQLGQSYELDAIAAVILGGTSFVGGIGSIWGTLIGALIIAVLSNGLILCGVSDIWQFIIKGVVIIVAVSLDRYRLRGSART